MPESVGTGVSGFLAGPGLLIIMLVAMVLLMILPQRKRNKKVKDMLDGIKVGDHVRTIGGFYGKVVQTKEDFFVIEVPPDHVKLTIARSAISTVENTDVENEQIDEVKK